MCDLCPTREHWADVMEQPEHWFGDMGDVFHSDPRGHIAPIFQVAGTAAMRTVADALGIAEDDCGVQADHWSYNHGSEHEQCDDNGRLFSPDHADYSARCVSCHKVYDLSR